MKRILILFGMAAGIGWLALSNVMEPVGRAAPQDAPKKADAPEEKPAEPKAPPPAAPVDPADAMIQQFEQQFGRQFRHMVRSELHFMRITCQPTKQQFEKIAADTEVTAKATTKQLAEIWQKMQRGGMGVQEVTDPRTPITDALTKSVRAHLASDQADRYQQELEKRVVARKKATVLSLVAIVDKILVLTPDQRDKMVDLFDKNWHKSWNDPQILMYGGQFFPEMPDAKMLPILTESQKLVWQGITKQRIHLGFHSHFNNLQGIDLGEEVWDDPAAPDQPKPVDKANDAIKGKSPAQKAEKK